MCGVVCVVYGGAISMVYGGVVCVVTNIESSSGVIMAKSSLCSSSLGTTPCVGLGHFVWNTSWNSILIILLVWVPYCGLISNSNWLLYSNRLFSVPSCTEIIILSLHFVVQ